METAQINQNEQDPCALELKWNFLVSQMKSRTTKLNSYKINPLESGTGVSLVFPSAQSGLASQGCLFHFSVSFNAAIPFCHQIFPTSAAFGEGTGLKESLTTHLPAPECLRQSCTQSRSWVSVFYLPGCFIYDDVYLVPKGIRDGF